MAKKAKKVETENVTIDSDLIEHGSTVGLEPGDGEQEIDFKIRVLKHIDNLEEEDWDALPTGTQVWSNEADFTKPTESNECEGGEKMEKKAEVEAEKKAEVEGKKTKAKKKESTVSTAALELKPEKTSTKVESPKGKKDIKAAKASAKAAVEKKEASKSGGGTVKMYGEIKGWKEGSGAQKALEVLISSGKKGITLEAGIKAGDILKLGKSRIPAVFKHAVLRGLAEKSDDGIYKPLVE